MTEPEKTVYHSSGAVAKRVGLERWKFMYLVERGDLPGPSMKVPGRRLFTEADIQKIEAALLARPQMRGTKQE